VKAGFLNDLLKDMQTGVLDFTENGECSNCGSCCSDFLPISPEEIRRIAAYIKKNGITEQPHFLPLANFPQADFTCPFRNNTEKKCVIYPVRPAICKDFRCDKPRKKIEADKAMYHGLYAPHSMRMTFFGGEEDV